MFRCVISLHGIRTRGVWQKDLAPVLARHGLIPYALDYGSFSIVKFACRGAATERLNGCEASTNGSRATQRCNGHRWLLIASGPISSRHYW